MSVVVDTNVVAYFVLGTTPYRAEAAAFWRRADAPVAPASWEAELVNVIWCTVRAGVIDSGEGLDRLRLARALDVESVPVRNLWDGALARATSRDHPAYDTLFVELAARTGTLLATFDRGLLTRFPEVARRPRDL